MKHLDRNSVNVLVQGHFGRMNLSAHWGQVGLLTGLWVATLGDLSAIAQTSNFSGAVENIPTHQLTARPALDFVPNSAAPKSKSQQLNDLLKQARELADRGDYPGAIALYERAAQLEPKNPRIFSGIGYLQAIQENYPAAVTAYQQAIALSPRNPDFHYALGYSLARLGDYPNALAAYQAAVALKRNHVKAHLGIASVQLLQQNYDQALATYRQVLTIDARNQTAYEAIGSILLKQERFTEALNSLQKAADFFPRSSTIQINLGIAWLTQGNLQNGLAAFERAASLEPQNATIHLQIAKILHTQGSLTDALKSYERAVSLGASSEGWMAIASIREQQNDDLMAIIAYRQVLQIDRTNAIAYLKMGEALQRRERLIEAKSAFQEALSLYQTQGDREGVQKAQAAIDALGR